MGLWKAEKIATEDFSDEIHVLCILVRGANFSVPIPIIKEGRRQCTSGLSPGRRVLTLV